MGLSITLSESIWRNCRWPLPGLEMKGNCAPNWKKPERFCDIHNRCIARWWRTPRTEFAGAMWKGNSSTSTKLFVNAWLRNERRITGSEPCVRDPGSRSGKVTGRTIPRNAADRTFRDRVEKKKRYISKSQAKLATASLMSGILSATRSLLWISRTKGRLRIIFVAKHRAILLQAWRIIAGFSRC